MNKIFNDVSNNLLYSPLIGVYPAKVNLFTPYIADIAKIFFKIMENSKVEYYVFAGSSIGLIRNGKSIPWVDDYDIIIFEKDMKKLDMILTICEKNFFRIKKIELGPIINQKNRLSGYSIASPRYRINECKTSFFHVDIFISRVENGYVRNINEWGLYHRKNVPINYVKPQRYLDFDDLRLPFFHQFDKDIALEYGDVINNSIIHICHGRQKVNLNDNWVKCYDEFDNYQNDAINNTKKIILSNACNHSLNLLVDKKYNFLTDYGFDSDNYFLFMKYIADNIDLCSDRKIQIFNLINVKYVYDIKFFFKNIKFEVNINSIKFLEDIRFFIDKIDAIIVSDKEMYLKCESFLNSIIIINKPMLILTLDINKNLIKETFIRTENYQFITNKNNNLNNIKNIKKIAPITKPLNNINIKHVKIKQRF